MGAIKWLSVLFLLCGCSHVRYVQLPEHHYMDSLRVIEKTDSVLVHDSVYVSVASKGDTVYVERDRWRCRDVVRLRTDTFVVFKCDTVTQVVTVSSKDGGSGRIRWFEVMTILAITIIVFLIGRKIA